MSESDRDHDQDDIGQNLRLKAIVLVDIGLRGSCGRRTIAVSERQTLDTEVAELQVALDSVQLIFDLSHYLLGVRRPPYLWGIVKVKGACHG